jgi:hypothetical protein
MFLQPFDGVVYLWLAIAVLSAAYVAVDQFRNYTVQLHPMHMHGGAFTVVARDGVTLPPPARFDADVVNVEE